MQPIDKIVFGDNQFFGINHMSQEKAQQQAERFRDLPSIIEVYDVAVAAGIRAVMLNSNDRAEEICSHFRDQRSKYPQLNWYPSIPYPHKYANLVAEKGILPAVKEVLFENNSAGGVFGMLAKGGLAMISQDEIKLMQMLIDLELRAYRGLEVRAVFLQNVITDLILGFGIKEVLFEYCDYVRKKHKVLPGLITQNLPKLLSFLGEAGIGEVVVCSSFNKIGYLMSPDVASYEQAAKANDPSRVQIMAMSTLASGAIPAPEAYEFINRQKIQSVVFGASSARNIRETMSLIKL